MPDHETGGGFAIGASDTDDAKFLGGVTIFSGGD